MLENMKSSINNKNENMETIEYWKKRCELAEAYIEKSPCDPDIDPEQFQAYNAWQDFKNLSAPDNIKSLSDLDGKTIPVRFTVTKRQLNINVDDI